jgi:hypothetical protein
MSGFSAQPRQTWTWDGKPFKLFEKDLCLTSDGTIQRDQGNKYMPGSAQPILYSCSGMSPDYEVGTTYATMGPNAFCNQVLVQWTFRTSTASPWTLMSNIW